MTYLTDSSDPIEWADAATKPEGELQPCVNCGALSRNRWCSKSCLVAEDGVPFDEVPEGEDEDA